MDDSKRDIIMSGNEAIARGALEAGVGFCASYPGTPSTEITTRLFEAADEFDIHLPQQIFQSSIRQMCRQ